MIKALILIHLWSLIVAACAWALQRDKGEQLGASFPAPKVWLGLICLSLLPGALSLFPMTAPVNMPTLEILETMPTALEFQPSESSWSLNYLAVYIISACLFMSRTLFLWARLQRLLLSPTDEPDIFTTDSNIPPLTLSWPRHVVVLPEGLENQAALIRHERTHLRHHDAETTLGLLLLRDFMLRAPGMSYLIRQWRLAIELRADHAAIDMLSLSERKDYAALLLQGLRSKGGHTDGRTLPCPTAHLTSTRHRSVKMRLTKIMEKKPSPRKPRWSAALLLTALGASFLGLMGTNSLAKDEVIEFSADKIIHAKRVPPQIPENCPGLDPQTIKIEGKEITTNGKSSYLHTAQLGAVILKYDIRPDGTTHNPRVLKSTHPCFEANAKTALAKWMAEPQEKDTRDVVVLLRYLLTGETHEDLDPQLNDFLNSSK